MPSLGNEKPTLPQAGKALHAGAFRASHGDQTSAVEPGDPDGAVT
jgi:hypothetical protein